MNDTQWGLRTNYRNGRLLHRYIATGLGVNLGCAVGQILRSTAVMDEDRSGARQHIVRVLRVTPLPAFMQVKRGLLVPVKCVGVRGCAGLLPSATAVSRFSPGTASRGVPGRAGA
jgi:hypothetical protein